MSQGQTRPQEKQAAKQAARQFAADHDSVRLERRIQEHAAHNMAAMSVTAAQTMGRYNPQVFMQSAFSLAEQYVAMCDARMAAAIAKAKAEQEPEVQPDTIITPTETAPTETVKTDK